jgi:hypothetical protein
MLLILAARGMAGVMLCELTCNLPVAAESGGCAIPSRIAARVKFSSSATAGVPVVRWAVPVPDRLGSD